VFAGVLELGTFNGCDVPARVLASAGYIVLMPNHRHVLSMGYEAAKTIVGRLGDEITLDIEGESIL
jgi:hypothetical protein